MSSNLFMSFSREGADSALTDAPIGSKLEGGNTNHIAQPKGGMLSFSFDFPACLFDPLGKQKPFFHFKDKPNNDIKNQII